MKNFFGTVWKKVTENIFCIFIGGALFVGGIAFGSFNTFVTAETELLKQRSINLEEKALRFRYEVIIRSQQETLKKQEALINNVFDFLHKEGIIPSPRPTRSTA